MEFSMNAHPDDFFPVRVSFMSKRPFCDIEVSAVVMSYSQHLYLYMQNLQDYNSKNDEIQMKNFVYA